MLSLLLASIAGVLVFLTSSANGGMIYDDDSPRRRLTASSLPAGVLGTTPQTASTVSATIGFEVEFSEIQFIAKDSLWKSAAGITRDFLGNSKDGLSGIRSDLSEGILSGNEREGFGLSPLSKLAVVSLTDEKRAKLGYLRGAEAEAFRARQEKFARLFRGGRFAPGMVVLEKTTAPALDTAIDAGADALWDLLTLQRWSFAKTATRSKVTPKYSTVEITGDNFFAQKKRLTLPRGEMQEDDVGSMGLEIVTGPVSVDGIPVPPEAEQTMEDVHEKENWLKNGGLREVASSILGLKMVFFSLYRTAEEFTTDATSYLVGKDTLRVPAVKVLERWEANLQKLLQQIEERGAGGVQKGEGATTRGAPRPAILSYLPTLRQQLGSGALVKSQFDSVLGRFDVSIPTPEKLLNAFVKMGFGVQTGVRVRCEEAFDNFLPKLFSRGPVELMDEELPVNKLVNPWLALQVGAEIFQRLIQLPAPAGPLLEVEVPAVPQFFDSAADYAASLHALHQTSRKNRSSSVSLWSKTRVWNWFVSTWSPANRKLVQLWFATNFQIGFVGWFVENMGAKVTAHEMCGGERKNFRVRLKNRVMLMPRFSGPSLVLYAVEQELGKIFTEETCRGAGGDDRERAVQHVVERLLEGFEDRVAEQGVELRRVEGAVREERADVALGESKLIAVSEQTTAATIASFVQTFRAPPMKLGQNPARLELLKTPTPTIFHFIALLQSVYKTAKVNATGMAVMMEDGFLDKGMAGFPSQAENGTEFSPHSATEDLLVGFVRYDREFLSSRGGSDGAAQDFVHSNLPVTHVLPSLALDENHRPLCLYENRRTGRGENPQNPHFQNSNSHVEATLREFFGGVTAVRAAEKDLDQIQEQVWFGAGDKKDAVGSTEAVMPSFGEFLIGRS